MKMSSNDSAPDPPSVLDEYANILLSQCKLFGIPNSAIEGIRIRNIFLEPSESETSTINIPETSSFAKGINDALNSKISALKDAENEIIRLEMKLEDHDNFISTFASGDIKDVIILNVSGTAMTTKRSTLRVFEESVLARQFDDSTWTDQNDTKVKEWIPDEVFKWAKTIEGIPDNVASLFKDNVITSYFGDRWIKDAWY